MTERLVYETHMHTELCRHADGEPEHYAAVADERGMRGIIVTCHNPMPDRFGHIEGMRMYQHELPEYLALVERAREAMSGVVEVHLGLECDFFPGFEDDIAATLDAAPFQYVLGSVHPFTAIWRDRFRHDTDPRITQVNYFQQLAEAAESGLFDCLAHPDLIKNMMPRHWKIARLRDDIARCLDRIADTGIAMELNTSGRLKSVPEMNPAPPILREMHKRSIPVVVGADAHIPQRVGEGYLDAYALLESVGYTHVSYFLARQRREIPITDAAASLRAAVTV